MKIEQVMQNIIQYAFEFLTSDALKSIIKGSNSAERLSDEDIEKIKLETPSFIIAIGLTLLGFTASNGEIRRFRGDPPRETAIGMVMAFKHFTQMYLEWKGEKTDSALEKATSVCVKATSICEKTMNTYIADVKQGSSASKAQSEIGFNLCQGFTKLMIGESGSTPERGFIFFEYAKVLYLLIESEIGKKRIV